ncbi:MAG: hypothetical protein ACUVSM_00390 [Armatimonadota bacterium]|jgi:hypothetical protein
MTRQGGDSPHLRGITVTLALLDETLCEIEELARGRERQSILFRERNRLAPARRSAILERVASMREVIRRVRDALDLQPDVQEAAVEIRSLCAGLWEHVIELKPGHLARYGPLPEGLASTMDPAAEELAAGLADILDLLKRR